jgi:hypothetical protein
LSRTSLASRPGRQPPNLQFGDRRGRLFWRVVARHCYHGATVVTARRPYNRHGLQPLKVRVKVRGLGAIDRRTAVARALPTWRSELVQDLGGPDGVSAQKRALLDLAYQTKLLLDSVDAWLLEQPTLINARRRTVLPVVLQRQQLADALSRYLQALGLERRGTPARPALVDYVAHRYRRPAPVAPASSVRTPSGVPSAAGVGEDMGTMTRGRHSGAPDPLETSHGQRGDWGALALLPPPKSVG